MKKYFIMSILFIMINISQLWASVCFLPDGGCDEDYAKYKKDCSDYAVVTCSKGEVCGKYVHGCGCVFCQNEPQRCPPADNPLKTQCSGRVTYNGICQGECICPGGVCPTVCPDGFSETNPGGCPDTANEGKCFGPYKDCVCRDGWNVRCNKYEDSISEVVGNIDNRGIICYKCPSDSCEYYQYKSAADECVAPAVGQEVAILPKELSGKVCYECIMPENVCEDGWSATKPTCSTGYELKTETQNGATCYKCEEVIGTCNNGWSATKPTCSTGYELKTETQNGATCYKCVDDKCPTGYSKTQTSCEDTVTTAAGSTCWKIDCENSADTCKQYNPEWQNSADCGSDYTAKDVGNVNGKACYKCELKTCKDYNANYKPDNKSCLTDYKAVKIKSGVGSLNCYECKKKECSDYGYSKYDSSCNDCYKSSRVNPRADLTCYTCVYDSAYCRNPNPDPEPGTYSDEIGDKISDSISNAPKPGECDNVKCNDSDCGKAVDPGSDPGGRFASYYCYAKGSMNRSCCTCYLDTGTQTCKARKL